jgi:hypothetical protein
MNRGKSGLWNSLKRVSAVVEGRKECNLQLRAMAVITSLYEQDERTVRSVSLLLALGKLLPPAKRCEKQWRR